MLDRLTRLAPERAMKLIAKQMADLLKHWSERTYRGRGVARGL